MPILFWLFLCIFALSVGCTLLIGRLWPLSFAPGAAISLVVSFFPAVSEAEDVLIFLAVSILSFLLLHFLFRSKPLTAIEALVGRRCRVLETVDGMAVCGLVEVDGMLFAARSLSGKEYPAGAELTVVAIEGVRLICGE